MTNDSKKLVILGIIALIVIGAGVVFGFSGGFDGQQSSDGALTAEPVGMNMGDIDIFGGKKFISFVLANNGDEPIEITSAYTTCMCTEAYLDDLVITMHTPIYIGKIQAGGRKNVNVSFDPLAHGPDATGPVIREIIFKTNSLSTPEVKFRFDGNVVKNPGVTAPVGVTTGNQH